MKIHNQFYFCENCKDWVSYTFYHKKCECGHKNKFTKEEIAILEEAINDGGYGDSY